jgi:methionine synthase I (cobalamin-dependent)/5,10-methylenetetrahydrofolate reductase
MLYDIDKRLDEEEKRLENFETSPQEVMNLLGISQESGLFFFDGAFGTYYYQKRGKNPFCEYANLNDQDTVLNIHREYIGAGVHAIKTNTFGANSLLTGDRDTVASIIQNGFAIATAAAAGTDVKVFADIGFINSEDENVADEYRNLAKLFIGCGAKYFIFETLAEFEEILPAIRLIKTKVPGSIVLVSFAVSQEGFTSRGCYYKNILEEAAQSEFTDIVGLNCLCGPSHMARLLQNLENPAKPLSAMPNSGYPAVLNGRCVYQDNADYFSDRAGQIHSLGVRILGGCCGTTPAHIRAMIRRIGGKTETGAPKPSDKTVPGQKIAPRNSLKSSFEAGKKVIAVELDAPIDLNCGFLTDSAARVHACGADLVTVADSPLARTRADSIMIAAKVKRDTSVNVLPHLCCRDRNHIGIKAALLAGKIEGIENILVITGDPVSQADRGEYKGVFNFNSAGLISFIRRLNEEVFASAPYYIGGAINPNALQFSAELMRASQKVANGAEFLLSQPVFTDQAAENLKHAKKELGCRILAGILPIAGYKNALFLNNEVSGITIPESLIAKLKDKTAEEARAISIEFCMEIVKKTYSTCDGYYIMTPLRKVDLVCDLISKIRSMES